MRRAQRNFGGTRRLDEGDLEADATAGDTPGAEELDDALSTTMAELRPSPSHGAATPASPHKRMLWHASTRRMTSMGWGDIKGALNDWKNREATAEEKHIGLLRRVGAAFRNETVWARSLGLDARSRARESRYFIHPERRFRRMWDVVVLLFVVYNAFSLCVAARRAAPPLPRRRSHARVPGRSCSRSRPRKTPGGSCLTTSWTCSSSATWA